MPFKLLVSRTTDAATPDEYLFDQDALTIGRDSSSHLTLPDLKRVVSKQHAELRWEGGAYKIVDLGSKNFTYLNDQRLQSGKPYEVHFGDAIKIGDFEIRLEPVSAPIADQDGTVFDVSFINPFAEDVAQLVASLRNIRDSYDDEAPSRRDDALKEALQTVLDNDVTDAYGLVGQMLSPGTASAGFPPGASAETPPIPDARGVATPPADTGGRSRKPRQAPELSHSSEPQAHEPARAPSPRRSAAPHDAAAAVPPNRLDTLVEALVQVAARLANIPWQFRHEFIGQTIVQSAETAAVYSGDAEALREYLFDPRIPDDELERRLDLLTQAAEDVALHQLAMLDGYRAGALQGTQRLLQEIDPVAAEAEARQEGGLNRILGFRASEDALERLKKKLQELQGEDWSVAERRIFRPAFIKAYLARMTSLRKQ